jgi:quercetin dioxygenase-like cupin family protein
MPVSVNRVAALRNPTSEGLSARRPARSIAAMNDHVSHTPAGRGPHHLMLGTVTVSRVLGGEETAGELSLVELSGLPGSGPGPHIDAWRETFYVLDGELTFRYEQDGAVHAVAAGPGDAVTIPTGVGHAFSVTSEDPARYLIMSTPAGIDAFFADAGEAIPEAELPSEPPAFDRERLIAAFDTYGARHYDFPEASPMA